MAVGRLWATCCDRLFCSKKETVANWPWIPTFFFFLPIFFGGGSGCNVGGFFPGRGKERPWLANGATPTRNRQRLGKGCLEKCRAPLSHDRELHAHNTLLAISPRRRPCLLLPRVLQGFCSECHNTNASIVPFERSGASLELDPFFLPLPSCAHPT